MTTLHLDLTRIATRRSILADLRDRLDGDAQAALDAAVAAAGVPEKHHHDLSEVFDTIDALAASDQVKDDMYAIYGILAQAEATAHGCEVEQTHFHEVGNGEALRNVCAVCLAIEALEPERITATAVQTGSGKVQCAHGELDIPAPATAAILATGIPVYDALLDGELCTPTSAALVKHFVDEFVA
ncbi:MAG: nickel insertion protein [Gordonibacter sp.]|uniref:nickel insertion protein n=1 Tax=Gordonibacter sp. TaxID=1968902 RepID=UPI002FC9B2FF